MWYKLQSYNSYHYPYHDFIARGFPNYCNNKHKLTIIVFVNLIAVGSTTGETYHVILYYEPQFETRYLLEGTGSQCKDLSTRSYVRTSSLG